MNSRVILITGGNGGLGQAAARAFLCESPENSVWLGVRARRQRAEALCGEFSERCHYVELDVTRPEAWRTAVERVVGESHRLDVLVNNAGNHHDGLLATLPPRAWQEVLATNLEAAFHGARRSCRR